MTTSTVEPAKLIPTDTDLPFWSDRWQANKTGFHRNDVADLFKKYLLAKLVTSNEQQCVLFPLCGKTLDMKAVLDAGHRVIGVEGARKGVEAFFDENQIAYELEQDANDQCQIYKGTDRPITIYCTDFFDFTRPLPPIDWIWDRGGLVAIPPSKREQYRDILYHRMTPGRTHLYIVAINYDDPKMTGPPHRMTDDDVTHLFGSECFTELLEIHDETDDYNSRVTYSPLSFIEERVHLIVRKAK